MNRYHWLPILRCTPTRSYAHHILVSVTPGWLTLHPNMSVLPAYRCGGGPPPPTHRLNPSCDHRSGAAWGTHVLSPVARAAAYLGTKLELA